jgi:hypothetical protein
VVVVAATAAEGSEESNPFNVTIAELNELQAYRMLWPIEPADGGTHPPSAYPVSFVAARRKSEQLA